jgi:hypothetical protein
MIPRSPQAPAPSRETLPLPRLRHARVFPKHNGRIRPHIRKQPPSMGRLHYNISRPTRCVSVETISLRPCGVAHLNRRELVLAPTTIGSALRMLRVHQVSHASAAVDGTETPGRPLINLLCEVRNLLLCRYDVDAIHHPCMLRRACKRRNPPWSTIAGRHIFWKGLVRLLSFS